MSESEIVVVGGGIVGLATAYRMLQRSPSCSIVILEKESRIATHQTGHNSGVLHSGIYYKPGSLKSRNCRLGKEAMEQFCAEHGIDFDICGKVIVAVDESEIPALENIYERGQQNGVSCERIGQQRLKELEPHCAGIEAIHVPSSGIVNYKQVCEKLAEVIQNRGGRIVTAAKVQSIDVRQNRVITKSTAGDFESQYLINCAGLHSDRVSKLTGQPAGVKIIPFRGEYYELRPEAHHLCKNLIYPVPDPKFPFLGVHFTRMIDGPVECGPNAVLAFAREGYRMRDVNFRDLLESLTYPGFLKLALKYWKTGAGEMWRSISKAAFVKALQRLIPEISAELLESAPAGVRAQAISTDGLMVDDFLIKRSERIVNVCNAPSPAATSSLNIGDTIVDELAAVL